MSIDTSAFQTSAFKLHDLKRAEEAYRFVLRQESDNMEIRLSLAWALLFQSLYFAGQETAAKTACSPGADITPGTESKKLLTECLRHSSIVKDLSMRISSRMEAERLEALVLMSGDQELLIANDARGARIRSELLHAVCQSAKN